MGTGPLIFLAVLVIRAMTVCALKDGYAARTSAASPEARPVDIDVPLQVAYWPPGTVLHTLTPGAATSTQDPKSENDARVSVGVVAPTASRREPPSPAGNSGWFEAALPAAATTTMPRPLTARSLTRSVAP